MPSNTAIIAIIIGDFPADIMKAATSQEISEVKLTV